MKSLAVLIEATCYDPVTASTKTVRFTNHDDPRATTFNGQSWRPILVRSPAIGLSVFNGNFTGFGETTIDSFTIAASELDLDAIAAYTWHGATVKIYAGDLATSTFPLIFTAVGEGLNRNSNLNMTIGLQTNDFLTARELLYLSYAGTSNIEGTADVTGVLKPMVFGDAKYCQPVLLDEARQIYQVHGYGPVESIYGVFEGGLPVGTGGTPAASFSLSGGDTYATFRDAAIAVGQWTRFNDLGLIKLGSQPTFPITCHVKGDSNGVAGGTCLKKAADIVKRMILMNVTGVSLSNASITALNTAAPYPIDLYFDSQVQVLDAVAIVLRSIGAYWFWDATGIMCFGRMRFGTSSMVLSAKGDQGKDVMNISQLATSSPVWSLRFGAQACHFVHDASSVPSILLDIQDQLDLTGFVFPPGPTPPVGPVDGDLWPDTSGTVTVLRRYDGGTTTWVAVDSSAVLATIVDDDVLSIMEKAGALAVIAADLEARYTSTFNRMTTLALSTTALTTARTNWRTLLASYNPAWNDLTLPTTIFVTAFADQAFPTGWTATCTNAANGVYRTLTDSSGAAAQTILRARAQAAATTQYSGGFVVKKDAVVSTTRAPRLEFQTSGGTSKVGGFNFDSSTGASGGNTNLDAFGVLDLGDAWFVWGTFTTNANNTGVSLVLYPAYNVTIASSAVAVATTGAIDARSPVLALGAATKLGRNYLIGTMNAFVDRFSGGLSAISSVDATLANVVDGPKSITVEVDSSGAAISLPINYTYYLKNSAGIITSGITSWKYVVLSGTVNGHAAGATEYSVTLDTGAGIFALNSLTTGTGKIELRAYIGTLMWPFQVDLDKHANLPGSGGGSGGGSLPSGAPLVTGVSGTTFVQVGEITATTGAGQTSVAVAVSCALSCLSGSKNDSVTVELKARRKVAGTPTDIGSVASGSASIVNWEPNDGSVDLSFNDTGLSGSTSYVWSIWVRTTVAGKSGQLDGSWSLT